MAQAVLVLHFPSFFSPPLCDCLIHLYFFAGDQGAEEQLYVVYADPKVKIEIWYYIPYEAVKTSGTPGLLVHGCHLLEATGTK